MMRIIGDKIILGEIKVGDETEVTLFKPVFSKTKIIKITPIYIECSNGNKYNKVNGCIMNGVNPCPYCGKIL